MEKLQKDRELQPYICSYICNGKLVNVFMDDYGQQYFYEYVDDEGNLQSVGCGAYAFDYEAQIEHDLDYDAWFDKQDDCIKEMIIRGKRRVVREVIEKPNGYWAKAFEKDHGITVDQILNDDLSVYQSITKGLLEAILYERKRIKGEEE